MDTGPSENAPATMSVPGGFEAGGGVDGERSGVGVGKDKDSLGLYC
ncbi:MAG: hypothetical protein JOZ19_06155 [Rubrobacter sp.]|nr:hypothetical protein [Rubrobacter sp.]